MKRSSIEPVFVEIIPKPIEDGKLYISQKYRTAVHRCCCGCGNEVVTPLGPTMWNLGGSEKFVTLEPSIGNWSLSCRSHYFIRRNRIVWAGEMSQRVIQRVRERALQEREDYFAFKNAKARPAAPSQNRHTDHPQSQGQENRSSLLDQVTRWIRKFFLG